MNTYHRVGTVDSVHGSGGSSVQHHYNGQIRDDDSDISDCVSDEDDEISGSIMIDGEPEFLSYDGKRRSVCCPSYCWILSAVALIYVISSNSRTLRDRNHSSDNSSSPQVLVTSSFGQAFGGSSVGVSSPADMFGDEEEESKVYQYNAKNNTIVDIDKIIDNEDYESNDTDFKSSSTFHNSPEVAWIMSFGGSGTSYTIMNTEKMTNLTTASNYGADYIPCISYDKRQNGPYVRSLDKELPVNFLLTKTHCGGYCMDCPPSSYVHTVESFEKSCRTGQKRRPNGNIVETTYTSDIPKRAIHLIRNPFDNLVGRMHLAVKHRVVRVGSTGSDGNLSDEAGYESYGNDLQGMARWCQYLDTTYAKDESRSFSSNFVEKYGNVPCHAEWFRYIQWHNLAYEVHENVLKLPVHYLYYDNYTTNFNEAVSELFDFLEFPPSSLLNDPYPWIAGKSYNNFFDFAHASGASQMVKELALPPVWDLIQHYFDRYFTEYYELQEKEKADEEAIDDESDDSILSNGNDSVDVNGSDNGAASTFAANSYNDSKTMNISNSDDPQVVWLLSFPNSGTSYTITNVEKVSGTTTASNYASDFETIIPVRDELKNGPFLHRAGKRVPDFVLTKTHCSGYCDDCAPINYIVKTTVDFTKGCTTALKKSATTGKEVELQYSTSVPVKAVHLIRSPFDNIVSRLHLAIKKKERAGGLTKEQSDALINTKDGFDAWCEYIDMKYELDESETITFTDDMKRIFKNLPCHADWYRYIQWHNNAVAMLDELKIPVHVMYYEDYTNQYNETLHNLLGFLDLDEAYDPIEFIEGKTYGTYFSSSDAQNALKLVRTAASPRSWELLKHYFEGVAY